MFDAMLDAIDALEEGDPETSLEILYNALWVTDEEENENSATAEASAYQIHTVTHTIAVMGYLLSGGFPNPYHPPLTPRNPSHPHSSGELSG